MDNPPENLSQQTHIRSLAAAFWLPTFCHSFMWGAEEVLSLSPARCSPAFPKRTIDRERRMVLKTHRW